MKIGPKQNPLLNQPKSQQPTDRTKPAASNPNSSPEVAPEAPPGATTGNRKYTGGPSRPADAATQTQAAATKPPVVDAGEPLETEAGDSGMRRLPVGAAVDQEAQLVLDDHGSWRASMLDRLGSTLGLESFGVTKAYLVAGEPGAATQANSKIGLLVRANADPARLEQLQLYLEGWSAGLGILNDLMTGQSTGEGLLEMQVVASGDRPEELQLRTPTAAAAAESSPPPRLDRLQIKEDGHWRFLVAERLARCIDTERFAIEKAYVFGSAGSQRAGPGSDIDMIFHIDDDPERQQQLEGWLSGVSLCIGAFNELLVNTRLAQRGEARDEYVSALRAGCEDGLLDVFCVTDELIASDNSWAAHIGSTHNPATPLKLGGG